MTHQTLYIIHGWTYTTSHWAKTLEIMRRDGFPVEMLNVPGLTTESKKIFTIEDYVSWAKKSLPKGSIALGHSNGGRILLNLLSIDVRNGKSSHLSHLILLDSAGVYEASKKRDLVKALSRLGAPLKKSKFLRKVFHKLTGAADYSHAPENMKKTMQNMLESDKHLKLEGITTPTSILWGEKDTVTPPRMAKVLNEKLPNSTLKLYKNWTHSPYIVDPAGLARALESIIKEIEVKNCIHTNIKERREK